MCRGVYSGVRSHGPSHIVIPAIVAGTSLSRLQAIKDRKVIVNQLSDAWSTMIEGRTEAIELHSLLTKQQA